MRLDLWLHAARFYKTRALAVAAVESGRVELNGLRTKRGKTVRPGDQLRIRIGPYEHHLTIVSLARRRGPAAAAAALYRESPESIAAQERLTEQHRLAAELHPHDRRGRRGRPTKRDRRELERWKDRS